MRFLVHVRHFVSAAGRRKFPAVVRLNRRLASGHPGFVALRRFTPMPARPDEIHVMLEFSGLRQLRRWRASPDHQRVAAAYAPCWRRPPEVQFFKITNS
jgi:antibiotic biosynthesis monooxygenase (ABM) superfamily enzyme